MVQVSGNVLGVAIGDKYAAGKAPIKTGTTVLGDDGKTYQFVKSNATIAANNTAVNITVSSGEYVAANSGGSADATVATVSGEFAWFKLD